MEKNPALAEQNDAEENAYPSQLPIDIISQRYPRFAAATLGANATLGTGQSNPTTEAIVPNGSIESADGANE